MSLIEQLAKALSIEDESAPVLVGDDAFDEMPDGSGATPAAVLVPVVDRPQPSVILTVRPQTMRRHAGQISFPGGRIDPGDENAVAAALREAEEEIALKPAEVEVMGTFDLYRTVTGFEITPVVGLVQPGVTLFPGEGEVETIFEAPLDFLIRPENQHERRVQWQGRERTYFEIQWQDQRIWGATAAMIVNLSRRMARVR